MSWSRWSTLNRFPTVLRVLEEVLLVQGRAAIAEQLYEHALAFYDRAFGPDHPRTVRTLKELGWAL